MRAGESPSAGSHSPVPPAAVSVLSHVMLSLVPEPVSIHAASPLPFASLRLLQVLLILLVVLTSSVQSRTSWLVGNALGQRP